MGEINDNLCGRSFTILLCSLCLGVLVVNSSAAEPALDTTDERYIQVALRALKMSEHDLSFSKTNVEAELILGKARTFLQQPLALPADASDVLSNVHAGMRLGGFPKFSFEQL